ncbi:flagellin, partial [Ruminococcaceae bacterium OttesenSCG-928-A11]|nr:flagellin [Ruminococcaceae bacterium OttesenSCG-928-A11]
MIIQNNIMGLNAQRQQQLNTIQLQSSLQKLSSGYRINSAADDAAGLAISEKMRAQQTALERAMMNAQDGVSLVQTAEGSLGQVNSMLTRLTELATQASNGVLSDSQRSSINNEAQQLLKEMDRISQATNFNGTKLLDGSLNGKAAIGAAVSGVSVDQNAATAGQYAFEMPTDFTGLQAGDQLSFSLAMNNGDSNNVTFTISDDLATMTGSDGSTVALNGTISGGTVDVSADVMMNAVSASMQGQSAGVDFTFAANADGAFTMTNREAGTAAPQVTGLSYSVNNSGAWQRVAATTTAPTDAGRSISADSFSLFDGTNEAGATFTVNGSKFALVADDASYASTVSQLKDTGTNVIRVSGSSLTDDDLVRISAEVNHKTGLALEANSAGDAIDIKVADGGRGLTLQVGDTAAIYNQVNVNISNMGSRGLGLSGIDLSTQAGASSALSRIGAAIDKVTTTRGDLGATQNRLESTISNLATANENITAAESRIRDADMAKMMMQFVKQSVLTQSGQ